MKHFRRNSKVVLSMSGSIEHNLSPLTTGMDPMRTTYKDWLLSIGAKGVKDRKITHQKQRDLVKGVKPQCQRHWFKTSYQLLTEWVTLTESFCVSDLQFPCL